MRHSLLIAAVAALSVPALAQQLEPNSPGGALTRFGVDPVPGAPFVVGVSSSVDLGISGGPALPIILVTGNLASASLPVPLTTQFFDLDLSSAAIIGDGLGGMGSVPSIFFFTNGQGSASYSFATNPLMDGASFGFQAIVSDATLPPLDLNFTAAAQYDVTSAVVITGDTVASFSLGSPRTFYGNQYTQLSVSTHGWIRFGAPADTSAPIPSAAAFTGGTAGSLSGLAAPLVAPLWTPMLFSPGTGMVVIRESFPGVITIDYDNPLVLDLTSPSGLSSIGGFSCCLDFTGGPPLVTFDYTILDARALAPSSALPLISGSIVGITDGGTASSVVNAVDLVTNGMVNGAGGINAVETIYEDFTLGGSTTSLPSVDLDGTKLRFTDASSTGAGMFQLF